jgi:DNA-binding NarL/FixJ family response regulator
MIAGDYAAAADAFGAAGWSYDRALMLSLLNSREALGEALELAKQLGAAPLAARVRRRLRELGLRAWRGPLGSTRSNPAGLTRRQLEVLGLVAEGLTNTEIGDRLCVSQRTAEHHVEAILTKLDVSSRREAARRYVAEFMAG